MDGGCAAIHLFAVGTSFWQQPWEAGIAVFPHWAVICLQQARSAGVRCAPGRTQAIAGVSSGNRTAMINANWRIAFIQRPAWIDDGHASTSK
jgi:hypothetical protein